MIDLMSNDYLKQYDEFIDTYHGLFHLQSTASLEDVLHLIDSVLISKYQMHITDLVSSLFVAIQFNYRSVRLYLNIINQIFTKYTFSTSEYNVLRRTSDQININIAPNSNNVYKVNLDLKEFPKEDEIEYIIMYDQIDRFMRNITEIAIDNIYIDVFNFPPLSAIEAAAYFGSVNIFFFLLSNLNKKITPQCLQYSLIGENTDIINECLKKHEIDEACLYCTVRSHNDEFLKYIIEHDICDIKDIETSAVILSQNLKALFLMFEKDKNSIIPWCAAIPQSLEILKHNDFDYAYIDPVLGTLLSVATTYNNYEICKLLLENDEVCKTIINLRSNLDNPPLLYAVKNNYIEIAKLLILRDADLNAKDLAGQTALQIVSIYNCKEIAGFLISNGANINEKEIKTKKSAIHFAAANNSVDVLNILITNGADVNDKAKEKATPLYFAILSHHKEASKFLISHGADINFKGKYGITPLIFATRRNLKEIVELLISNGAEINAKTDLGLSALHHAASQNYKDIAECLILHGANVNIKDNGGHTPLYYAAGNNGKDVVILLISYGINVYNKEDINSSLFIAVAKNNKEITKILIDNGADINTKDTHGLSVLHIAVQKILSQNYRIPYFAWSKNQCSR
ncbi:hypothetical protein TVAG_309980 [Trichomonas vaginalis G3]|uniref:DUF3447 domain-containing protein n=1 Tax=Trichomonas vaginalis (strain ATCC PRA-98 / G3) TaxID=412133 RepID=A2EKR4_TRIV3|nr:spectrin binding [Trichomonas vaginalis G3]EAY06711.1 hypothetical protein TVAG_309980 [Trichomonas vaginalis G3]KAI5500995.1 spectrin binding [Trichomonas vaginalis G3]|eukprot:XP_001318934.1 hypothetical protein [Trichomonas vaginalis G3]